MRRGEIHFLRSLKGASESDRAKDEVLRDNDLRAHSSGVKFPMHSVYFFFRGNGLIIM